MKVSKREKTLLIVVLLLAVVCAYYLLFLKPYLSEISELNMELASSETQVQTYSQLKTNVDMIDGEIESKKAEINEFSNEIPVGFDQPLVLIYLEDTVGKHAQKSMFVFGTPQQLGQMLISPVTITMVTTYDGLKDFIEDVTGGEYIVNITSIDALITSNEAATNEQAFSDVTTSDGSGVDNVPEPEADKTEGAEMVEDSDELLQVSMVLEIYSMYGSVPTDIEYDFDDSYKYGGDIFY